MSTLNLKTTGKSGSYKELEGEADFFVRDDDLVCCRYDSQSRQGIDDLVAYRLPPSIQSGLDEFFKLPNIPTRVLIDNQTVWDNSSKTSTLFDAVQSLRINE